MPVQIDKEKMKNALDSFENDDFMRAKEIIKGEIKGAISDYYKDKLELKNDLEPKQPGNEGGNDPGTGNDPE